MYSVKKCSNVILLNEAVQFSQHHLLKRLSLPHCTFFFFFLINIFNFILFLNLKHFVRDNVPVEVGFISGLSILFDWFNFCFCASHTVLMTIALSYCLREGKLIPPASFFFLKIVLFFGVSFVFTYEL